MKDIFAIKFASVAFDRQRGIAIEKLCIKTVRNRKLLSLLLFALLYSFDTYNHRAVTLIFAT